MVRSPYKNLHSGMNLVKSTLKLLLLALTFSFMPKSYRAPTGTADFLPADHDYFTFVKKVIRHRFRQSGFRRISPPVFEYADTFETALGMSSEITKRELYTFEDRSGRTYALRPELTTGVARAFVQHEMDEEALPVELYYIEPCFRFERPRSRTQRQFWQFGAEILGETDPAIDAQIMYLGYQILRDFGIIDACELKINTIGSPEDQKGYFRALADYYKGKERHLTPESQEKLKQGKFLDLLNPKNEDEEILAKMAPKIVDHLTPESREFFDDTLNYLNSFGIEYVIDPTLVRPVEYYSQTVFEYRERGTRNKVLVGGRYDGLVAKLGGGEHGGAGFAAGIERIIAMMRDHDISVPHKDTLQVFVAATGPIAKKHALPQLVKLRERGFHAVGVLGKTSMTEQLSRAQKFNVPYAILMGDIEVKEGNVIVRDMKTGKSETIAQEAMIDHMVKLIGEENLDTTTDFLGR